MNENTTELERISDDIRKGIPVDFHQAIAAIEYQIRLKEQREANSLKSRIKRVWARVTGGEP